MPPCPRSFTCNIGSLTPSVAHATNKSQHYFPPAPVCCIFVSAWPDSRRTRKVWGSSAPFEGDRRVLGPALNLLSLVEGIRPIHPVRLEDGETGFSRLGAHPRVVVNEDGYLSALR